MPLLYGQLVYTSFPEVGLRALASALVPTEIQLAFIQQVVYQHWDSYNPPKSGYRAAYLHQVTLEHTLFGWLYNDGPDDLGRSHVPYFVCYYYPQLLQTVQLENIFTCLHTGPIALSDRQSLPAGLETIVVPDLCSYQPARMGVAIPSGVRDRSHIALKQKRLLDLFVPVDEREQVKPPNEAVVAEAKTPGFFGTTPSQGKRRSQMTKIALLIGVSDYGPGFNSLPTAQKDVKAMQQILQHPEIGSFAEVRTLINPERQVMEEAIETVFSELQSDDLVLLYFSGYGIKDDSGKLYLTTSITRKNVQEKLVKSSVVPASFVQEIMIESRSKHQFVILDCCLSGTLTEGWSDKDDISVDVKNQLGGEGRVILASSTSTQCSFKQNESDLSIYTRYLVEGMETGAADLDNDGVILISELHEYASRKVQTAIPAMQPGIYGLEDYNQSILAKALINEAKRRYRQETERCANLGEFSIVSRSILDVLQDTLGLLPEEAAAIEAEVLGPYREYQKKLQRYVQGFVKAIHHESPISDDTRKRLKHLQLSLGLRDEDVAPIEVEITRQIKALESLDNVGEANDFQIPPSEEITAVKLLNDAAAAKEELAPAPTVNELSPEIIFTKKSSKLGSSKSTEPNLVPNGRNSRLIIGAGIGAAVLAMTGATYGVLQWQGFQRLKTIKALTQERKYEECIAVAKTISQFSIFYTDAQTLLKECEAGVNWQNVQAQNLRGHTDTVWSVAFSQDGQTLASGSSDNTIKIWQLGSSSPLRNLSGHTETVWSIAFSPNRQTLASGSSDNTIKIWQLGSGKLLRTLSGHTDAVSSIALSQDGQTLASGSSDNTIKIWQLGSGKLLRTLSGHTNAVSSIALSQDGQTLASGSSDNTIKIWQLGSGKLLRTLSGHTSAVSSVSVSPDGQLLASSSVDKTIKIWNPSSGKLLYTVSGRSESVNTVAISPDGRTLASGIGDTIQLWDLNTGKLLHTLSRHSSDVTSLSFSANGTRLASASQDNSIRIFSR